MVSESFVLARGASFLKIDDGRTVGAERSRSIQMRFRQRSSIDVKGATKLDYRHQISIGIVFNPFGMQTNGVITSLRVSGQSLYLGTNCRSYFAVTDIQGLSGVGGGSSLGARMLPGNLKGERFLFQHTFPSPKMLPTTNRTTIESVSDRLTLLSLPFSLSGQIVLERSASKRSSSVSTN
jgi:hypothetical protein